MSALAFLKHSSEWHSLFPEGVPIKNCAEQLGIMDGSGQLASQGVHRYYEVDLDRLSSDQKAAVVSLLSVKSGLSELEVAQGIATQPCLPLTDRHVEFIRR